MKIVIEIDSTHMPFVRQQNDLHGPEVRLDFEHFMAMLPGKVVGVVDEKYAALLPYIAPPLEAGP